jgi:hypothetical protein
MTEFIKIRKSLLKLSTCCKSPYMEKNPVYGELCHSCRMPWESFTPWYTESGNMMFELISDVNEKEAQS